MRLSLVHNIASFVLTLSFAHFSAGCRTIGSPAAPNGGPSTTLAAGESQFDGEYNIQSHVNDAGLWADVFFDGQLRESLPCQTTQGISAHAVECESSTMQFSMVTANGLKTNRLLLMSTSKSVYFSCVSSGGEFSCQQNAAAPPSAVDPSMPMARLIRVVATQKISVQFIDPMSKNLLETAPCQSSIGVDGTSTKCQGQKFLFTDVKASGLVTRKIHDLQRNKTSDGDCHPGNGTVGPDVTILIECYARAQ